MSKKEVLLSVIKSDVHEYLKEYADLIATLDGSVSPSVVERGNFGGDDYCQTEVEFFFDDDKKVNKRILGLIDDGRGTKGSYSIIIDQDANIVSEGGQITEKRAWW